ncbi:hypothetical protein AVEN_107878-1, partial [Araneus ventricosus]
NSGSSNPPQVIVRTSFWGSGHGPVMGGYESGLSTRAIAATVTQLYPGTTAGRGDSVLPLCVP